MNVVFVCTGNSARSLIAEAVLNHRARDRSGRRFRAFSAGSRPTGAPHPEAIEILEEAGYATSGLRSKSWDEFAGDGAVRLDLVVTLCDSAANEACPAWPGAPQTQHWGLPDPAAVEDSVARRKAFAETLSRIEQRIETLLGD